MQRSKLTSSFLMLTSNKLLIVHGNPADRKEKTYSCPIMQKQKRESKNHLLSSIKFLLRFAGFSRKMKLTVIEKK